MEANEPKPFTAEDEAEVRESLKRCSPETVEAAIAYRKSGDTSQVPVIIMGILERVMEPEARPKLLEGNDDTRINEDLGIDSLTMVEVIMMVEETLDITVDNEELRGLATIGDVKTFITGKLA
ncbi:acyl carrier protein [Ruficoccus amylovorans]|uniref:Acyl carrier protein n=1 Tax=Ruficoccus amylovorans TaxID=1804625 RepID=A0A842HIN0_9BACT|nr:phosphopantetheine-binding protein [Ruficoccus amylovorans]MBC2596262.1 acyl carrier protein [Ruficoccus amylovorans]